MNTTFILRYLETVQEAQLNLMYHSFDIKNEEKEKKEKSFFFKE